MTGPSNDFEPGEVEKVRFRIDNSYPQNYVVIRNKYDEQGRSIPVHDTSWDILQRISEKRFGDVGLDGFMAWWFVSIKTLPGSAMLITTIGGKLTECVGSKI